MPYILLPQSGLVQRPLIRSKQQDRDMTRSRFRDDSDSLFYLCVQAGSNIFILHSLGSIEHDFSSDYINIR